ncbi:unnamed protein product [Rhizoctonia solani]|uniref:NADP-dependent oxidoreductase domain-containing protein n=1 Tax=Rhizoctonia solani TaxID=456999 RepID=A0A8H3AN48_9AGAM|nr:unnamed protein product [Rhizoctonia solani]
MSQAASALPFTQCELSKVMPASSLTRRIGHDTFAAIGYATAWLGGGHDDFPGYENEWRFRMLDRLVELSCTHWDSASSYGDSEELIGKWLNRTGQREKIFLATKFGLFKQPDGSSIMINSPDLRESLNQSLKRLNADMIDIFYVHYYDKRFLIENTMEALAEYVKAGKIWYIGLCEPTVDRLRRAHKVHPVAAIQVEHSPFELKIETKGILSTARELGVAVVAYSPMGKGLLDEQIKSHSGFGENDPRKSKLKYSQENFPKISELVNGFKDIAIRHNATPGQIALAYLLAQGDDIIPIPVGKCINDIGENLGAQEIGLTPEELELLRKLVEHAESKPGHNGL